MSDLHNAPKAIWLQVDPEGDGPGEWDTHSDATWCVDKINNNDIEYVRADLIEDIERQRDKLLTICQNVVDRGIGASDVKAMKEAIASVKGQQ